MALLFHPQWQIFWEHLHFKPVEKFLTSGKLSKSSCSSPTLLPQRVWMLPQLRLWFLRTSLDKPRGLFQNCETVWDSFALFSQVPCRLVGQFASFTDFSKRGKIFFRPKFKYCKCQTWKFLLFWDPFGEDGADAADLSQNVNLVLTNFLVYNCK